MPDPGDAKTYAQPRVVAAGLDWPTHERQIQTESDWRHWAPNGTVLSSPTGSKGLSQINAAFYGPEKWTDPYANLDTGIAIMAGNLKRFGSYVKALAAYNWGPGNVGGYTKTDGTVVPPWDGRRETTSAQCAHYLDAILGPGWPEPNARPAAAPEAPVAADPWTRTQLTNGSAVSTPAEWPTSDPRRITALVWHDMEGFLPGAIATWNQGAASAHLCVLRDGTIVRTVPVEDIAWHAGTNAAIGRTAFWRANNINPCSIGVELEGFVASGYTPEQVAACVKIGKWARDKYGIQPVRGGDSLDGHHLHGEISNQRSDPGPLFPFDAILAAIQSGAAPQSGGPTVPDETYAQPGQVGTGILEMMTEDGTQPALPSIFHPLGTSPAVAEECIGMNGRRYLFHIPTGRRWKYDPAA